MRTTATLLLLTLSALVKAHGDHEQEASPDASYAELHMAQEHHFDSFDLSAFFHLHDLNRDGILDVNELESIYGVHHEKLKKKSGSVEVHTAQAKEIVRTVLATLDTNGDGVLTMREFIAGGVGGLPNFKGVEHLGHHYDAEGEYFLHHEEKYHNSPDTQKEEDYVHPEDIEHFMSHDAIESEEEHRTREFLGETDESDHDDEAATPSEHEHDVAEPVFVHNTAGEDPDGGKPQFVITPPGQVPLPIPVKDDAPKKKAAPSAQVVGDEEKARQERAAFAKAQAAKFGKDAREAAKRGEYGTEAGAEFRRPKDAADRLRKAVPYKFKVRKSFW